MTAPSPRFRQLAIATLLLTFLLIVIGGIVRVSDSGLGCGPANSGLEGWPFCNGDVVPGVDLHSIIEYTHRVVASVVGLMMLALAVLAWRNHREHRVLVRVTIAGFVLVAAQGALGGVVVEENLEEELVAAHLGLAMLLLAVLFWIWRSARPDTVGSDPPDGGLRYRPLAWLASVAVLCTIVAGGYMAGTQNYGRADYRPGDGAHHACGKEFPTCNGEFMPFGEARLVDIHLTHRFFMYIAVALVLALVVVTLRRRPAPELVRGAWAALGILMAQVLVGALNVWLDEYEALIVLHLALGTLLWWTVVAMTLSLYRVRSPVLAGGPVANAAAA
jgi:cytochrome c oxidase assembly protein subunit 15